MLADSVVIARAFLAICLLQLRPQDIPQSKFLLYLTLSTYTLLNIVLSEIGVSEHAAHVEAVLIALTTTLSLTVFTVVVMQLRGYPNRIQQTLTALAGSGSILSLPALPVIYWLMYLREIGARSAVADSLWLLLFVWSLFVAAHILRHALGTRLIIGFALTLVYLFAMLLVVVTLRSMLGVPGLANAVS